MQRIPTVRLPRREDHGETNPLMPGNLSQDTNGQISHKGSIFTFMLFMPPLSRKMYGHYWTAEVPLAFALFAMCVTLQLCLTLIAGASIVQTQIDARSSLISAQNISQSYLSLMFEEIQYLAEKGLDIAPKVMQELQGHKFSRTLAAQQMMEPQHTDGTGNWCCVGAACAGLEQCCPSVDLAKPVTANLSKGETTWGRNARKMSVFLQKPGGGGGKGAKAHPKEDSEGNAVKTEAAVCTNANGITSCMPPSVALLGTWHDLDMNADGFWSLEEAREDPSNFGCHVGVHLEDVFRAICRGIIRDSEDAASSTGGGAMTPVAVPQSVRARKAIPRAYFEWWRGLVAVCIHTDAAMCGELMLRGAFDGALSQQNNGTRGGMVDLDTTLAYCERLVAPGGICDSALPGSYVLYRARIRDKCGVPTPGEGPRYANPHKPGDVISAMTTSWSKLDEVTSTHGPGFQFFMTLILVLWYVNLVDELKEIIHLLDLLMHFPVEEDWPFITPSVSRKLVKLRSSVSWSLGGGSASEAAAAEGPTPECESRLSPMFTPRSIIIESFERPHQLTVAIMMVIRTVLLVYLGYAGTYFLLSNRSYMDLLLNALAMAFIFELDEFLFNFLVPEETKQKLDSLAPLTYKSFLPTTGCLKFVFAKYMWGLILIPVFAWGVVNHNDIINTVPMMKALQCACMQTGDQCLADAMFSRSWWDQYWAEMALLRARGEL